MGGVVELQFKALSAAEKAAAQRWFKNPPIGYIAAMKRQRGGAFMVVCGDYSQASDRALQSRLSDLVKAGRERSVSAKALCEELHRRRVARFQFTAPQGPSAA